MIDSLFTPYPGPTTTSVTSTALNTISEVTSISDNTLLMGILNKLEGCKTKIKELHFCAKQFSEERGNLHVLLDDVGDLLSNYQDVLGEVGQSFLGHMRFNTLVGTPNYITNPVEALEYIIKFTLEFRKNIPNEIIWTGITNATDDFIQNIQQKLYLGQIYLCNK